MENRESEQAKINGQVFIYFIEIHDKNRDFESHLINNSGIISSETEILEQKNFSFQNQFNYIYKVHRIMILIDSQEFELSVQFKEKRINDNNYERKIKNDEIIKDTSHSFLYNFQPIDKNKKICFSKNSSNEYPLSYFEQFKIYINILKEQFKGDRNSKEFHDCIEYAMNILNKIKYEFTFYMPVFVQCFDSKIVGKFLEIFNTKNLTSLGELSNEEIKNLEEILNRIEQEPSLVLEKIEKEDRGPAEIILYTIILIFDLKFQKEKLKLIKWKKDILLYIFSKYNHFIKLFDFNVIKDILILTDDCYTIFFILQTTRNYLLDKFNEFLQKIKEEKKSKERKGEIEKNLIIQIDKYIVFKDEEKLLGKILFLIESFVDFQKNAKTKFISFSPNFFQSLARLINDKNIELLFSIEKIRKSVKQYDISTKFIKIDIDKILDTIINHSIINKNFEFFKNECEDLRNYLYKNDKYLDEYAIELIRKNEKDEDFLAIRKDKKIDHDKNFINNACSVVNSLDQFNILLEILCGGKENKGFLESALICIQKTFFNICKKYKPEELMNYKDIISLLIHKSDICLQQIIAESFLEELQKLISKDFIVNLYINVLNKYKKLNTKIKINNFLEKLEPEYITILVKDLNENSQEFVRQKLKKYIIKEEDFFDIKDSISMQILTSLVSCGAIPKKDSSNFFLKETYTKIESIRNMIKNNDFTYKNKIGRAHV